MLFDCLGETEEIEIAKAKDRIAIELCALLFVKCTQPVIEALLLAGIGIPSNVGEENSQVGNDQTRLPRFHRHSRPLMTGLRTLYKRDSEYPGSPRSRFQPSHSKDSGSS